jgi:hypothetical protein
MKTPVIIFFYRRPHLIEGLMAGIRPHRPECLWLVADGPKNGSADEPALCLEARKKVEQVIDWPCRVHRLYAEKNLGLNKRFESGLDAVFAQESKAIILEEDCHPTMDFIPFCNEMLSTYQNTTEVGGISGNCFLPSSVHVSDSFFFSKYLHIWGWATWGRIWNRYNRKEKTWPKSGFRGFFPKANKQEANYWNRIYARQSKNYSWDYGLFSWLWSCSCLSINPTQNLVTNVGFGPGATNTVDTFLDIGIERNDPLKSPFRGPRQIHADEILDRALFKNSLLRMEGRRNLIQKLRDRVLRILGIPKKR